MVTDATSLILYQPVTEPLKFYNLGKDVKCEKNRVIWLGIRPTRLRKPIPAQSKPDLKDKLDD